MKLGKLVALTAAAGAGAYLVSRWNKVSEKLNEENTFVHIENHDDNEVEKEEKDEQSNDLDDNSNSIYPHLSSDFLKAIESQKNLFDVEYPIGSTVKIYNQIVFINEDKAQEFAHELEKKGYVVITHLEQCTVKSLKDFVVEKDSIIKEIYQVAEFAAIYDGSYQGYSIELV